MYLAIVSRFALLVGIIVRNEKTEVFPIQLGETNESCIVVNSFIEGLDTVFTESLVKHGKSIQSSASDKKIKELQTQITEQEKAIETVKERSNSITKVANSLFEMVAQGITSIQDEKAKQILSTNNATLTQEKGISLIIIADEKIRINFESSLQSIASVLFNEAKHQSKAIPSIEEIKIKTTKKLEKLQNKIELEKKN